MKYTLGPGAPASGASPVSGSADGEGSALSMATGGDAGLGLWLTTHTPHDGNRFPDQPPSKPTNRGSSSVPSGTMICKAGTRRAPPRTVSHGARAHTKCGWRIPPRDNQTLKTHLGRVREGYLHFSNSLPLTQVHNLQRRPGMGGRGGGRKGVGMGKIRRGRQGRETSEELRGPTLTR
jgi:hypothetical protein